MAKNNFPLRTRHELARNGCLTVTVDAVPFKQGANRMYGGFATSIDHVVEIDSVIVTVRESADPPRVAGGCQPWNGIGMPGW